MRNDVRPLLILDLDETLIHATGRVVDRAADFQLGPYHVYRRPAVDAFLTGCAERYRLAVWSSGGSEYVAGLVENLFADQQHPAFVWRRDRCTVRLDAETRDEIFLKDLRKVKRLGFDLGRVLIVEDEAHKVARHYGNLVRIAPFYGDANDRELPELARYLCAIHAEPNFRRIEKRGWRGDLGR